MKRKDLVINIFVLLIFLFLTILYTYPLVFNMHTSFFGDPRWTFDSKAGIYSIWLTNYSWLNKIPFTFNPLIAFPFGVDLTGRPSQWGLRIPLLLFSLWKDEIFSFNLFILSSFILSALIVYHLVSHITGSKTGGFISGLIYSFSPYHTLKSFSHLGLAAIQWIPLYILCLIILEEKRTYRMALWCGIALSIIVLSSYYYGYMAVVITIIFFLIKLLFKKGLGGNFYFITFGVAVILIMPFMYNEFRSTLFSSNSNIGYVRPYYDLFKYSARISDYFRPSEYHPIFGKIDFWFIKPYTSASRHWAERTLYLGIIPSILAIFGVIKGRKSGGNTRFVSFFLLLCALVGFLFSLPPEIRIGKVYFYLPNYFAYKILPMFRCPARFGVIVILGVAILAGIGIKGLLDMVSSPKKISTFVIGITSIILFEFTVIPPFRNVDLTEIPEVYRLMSSMDNGKVIVEYPFLDVSESVHNDRYLFYQRIHGKRLINGAPIGSLGDAFRRECLYPDRIDTGKLLAYLGADYMVVHKDRYSDVDLENIDKNKNLEFVKDFTEAKVYRIVAEPDELVTVFWQNFDGWEKWEDGNYWRWMGNDATVWVGNGPLKMQNAKRKMQNAKIVDIKFDILAFARERVLEVYVNDVLVKRLDVYAPPSPEHAQDVVLEDVLLQPAENIIKFYTPQGEDRIGDVLHNNDNRRVSFAISGVEVREVK